MSNYWKLGQPKGLNLSFSHPFKMDFERSLDLSGNVTYFAAINFHSRLFTGMTLNEKYLSYKKIPIQGLDFKKAVSSSFPGQNFYAVLRVTVSNLSATKAEIVWVSDDKSVEQLNPVVFDSNDSLKQTEARIIIGALVNDREAVAGTTDGPNEAKVDYVMQFINTNLMMCNMVFDGVPIIYPVPFGGGRLNF
jgi:hypothetical protein